MRYVFLGDRLTRAGLVGRPCDPVRRPPARGQAGGRVVRGRNGNALVVFDTGERVVVPGRRLRLAEKTPAPRGR